MLKFQVALDDETCVRTKVLADNRSLQTVLDQLRDQLDEEQENRAEIQRQLTKALGESAMWKQKFESGEGSIRPEEVEELKRKQAARIQDSEAHLEAVVGKVIGLEKAKSRLQTEVDTLLADIERVNLDISGSVCFAYSLFIVCLCSTIQVICQVSLISKDWFFI